MSISVVTVCNWLDDGYNLARTAEEDALGDRVTVDPELCMGSGECVRIAPTAFAIDDESNVSRPLPGAQVVPLDVLLEAARACPTNAIAVRADDGAVLVASAG